MCENHKKEAYGRWGDIDAYREYVKETRNYTKEKRAAASEGSAVK